MKKIGVPNRPVAARLMKLSENHDIMIRWADTHGEQFHAKAMSITSSDTGDAFFTAGSANWTKRNVGSRNMEANLAILGADEVTLKFNSWFDEIWNNSKGSSHTLPYEAWEEKGLKRLVKTGICKFQERWGMGTF
jgi:phosphatidylserine/phosphatidylglycerophosphate/cardiolipin synthase-like enzyme